MVDQSEFSAWNLPARIEQATVLDLQYLKGRVSWIRDDLDPLVARDGPHTLQPDTVIVLFKFFAQLRASYLPLETIRDSRIHLALIDIARRATRWPARLIEDIYGIGGRLHGISTPEDLQRELLLAKWSRKNTAWVDPNFSRRNGGLGFQAGE
jgi:hypothetical protein